MKLPKFVLTKLAEHDFNGYMHAYISRYGHGVKPRQFRATPLEIYQNGPDRFGERHIEVEERNIMDGSTMSKSIVVVGNNRAYQI